MKIRIYPGLDDQKPASAVATLVFEKERARSIAPAHVDRAARFHLERVDSQDHALRDRLIEALRRESVPVVRAAATRAPIRTRGSYRSTEHYGTPAYWRAAIGLLPSELGVRYDIGDYTNVLQSMETAEVAPAVVPLSEAKAEAPPQSVTGIAEILDRIVNQLLPRPRVVTRGIGPVSAPPPIDPEPLLRRIREDPEFLRAVFQFQQALKHPQFRQFLEATLEAFGREATSHDAGAD